MKLSDEARCKELIIRMVERQIRKPRNYHPTIMREFSEEERELVFGGIETLDDFQDEIETIVIFAISEKITSPKLLMRCCKMVCPDYITGAIKCGDPFIEVSTDLIPGELLIEIDDERKTLTKEELIELLLSMNAI